MSNNTVNNIYKIVIVLCVLTFFNTVVLISIVTNKSTYYTSNSNNNNNNNSNNESNNNSNNDTTYDISSFTSINANQINEKTKDKLSLVYIGRAPCGWCIKYAPILKEVAKEYNTNVLYIDLAKIIDFTKGNITDQTGYDTLVDLTTVENLKDYMKNNFGSTPMTLIIKDNKILDAKTGYIEKDSLISLLENNGFKN